MSNEFILAACAVLGVMGTAAVGLVKFGTMTQRLEQLEKENARLDASISAIEANWTAKMDRLIAGIDDKLDRIWEYLHQISTRRRTDSRPPLDED